MKSFWYFIYNYLVIPPLKLSFYVSGLFNEKVKRGIKGRKRLFEKMIIDLADLDKRKKRVIFHSSSLGEFEQAKPIIERLKKENDVYIIITFFSPSGYDNSVKYPFADVIAYLPFDTGFNTRRFVRLLKPDLMIFMRYDIWPNLIWQLNSRAIPIFIVDATMKENSKRKLPVIKNFHNTIYNKISKVLTVTDNDLNSFKDFKINSSRLKAVGDTRFDRVYQKSLKAKEKKLFKENFFFDKKVFVMGSSWEADEEVILPAITKVMKYDPQTILIIAPHEPKISRLEEIENFLPKELNSIRFSHLNNYKNERIIVIDSIGILSTLYFYSDAAYIGGSFKQGVHNVLEAAVYGVPVLYGPKIENSREALQLEEIGGGMVIRNKKQAYRRLRTLFADKDLRRNQGEISHRFVQNNIGATDKILSEINQYI